MRPSRMTTRLCCVDTHGAVDVLQPLLTKIGELDCHLASNLIVRGRGDADATRLSDALKSCGDVDTVSENVIALDEDVTEVDPDPKQHTPILRDPLVAFPLAQRLRIRPHRPPRETQATRRPPWSSRGDRHVLPRGHQ